ncbi:MAG: c-type cytochrome [Janthinobacterium lividum]
MNRTLKYALGATGAALMLTGGAYTMSALSGNFDTGDKAAMSGLYALSGINTAWAQAPHADTVTAVSKDAEVTRGAQLARAGDCIACHTVSTAKPFAGGLPIKTPFGTIYSTNITPDKNVGIGNYTYDDFARSLREGVAKDGHHLYPAMPYPSFAKINDVDMHALYAYFENGVPPLDDANRASDLHFPFNIRLLMAGWNLLFLQKSQYQPDPSHDAEWNRGAYLVQGLAHCGACHTPHGIAGQETAFDDKNTSYLTGYTLADWYAPNLRSDAKNGLGSWSKQNIVDYLRSGRSHTGAAFGAMTEVINDSTQFLSDADLNGIGAYLKSLPPLNQQDKLVASNASVDADTADLRALRVTSAGALLYLNNCNACHHSDGAGAMKAFPGLKGNPIVTASDPTSLIHIVLTGAHMPSTKTDPSPLAMPDFGWRLTDQQVADVLSYVRGSWGNGASPVVASQVDKVRRSINNASN